MKVLDLLKEVQSSRVQTMLAGTARVLRPHQARVGGVDVPGEARLVARVGMRPRAEHQRVPRSFQLSMAGSPYAEPAPGARSRARRGSRREVQRQTSQSAPMDRSMLPCANTSTSGPSPGPPDHLVRPGRHLAERLALRDAVAPMSQPGRRAWISCGVMPS
ncbi:hypothetical protein SALBM311S_12236 [Streptomyces alboniger]